ncbi:hypothetical protein D9M69_368060 [compost metagenome]
MQLVDRAGVELEVARHGAGIGAGLAQRLAGIARFQRGQLVFVADQRHGNAVEQAHALGRGHLAPGAVGGLARGMDRDVDIGGVAAGDLGEGLAVGRVEYLDAQAVVRRDQAVGDKVLGMHGWLRGSTKAAAIQCRLKNAPLSRTRAPLQRVAARREDRKARWLVSNRSGASRYNARHPTTQRRHLENRMSFNLVTPGKDIPNDFNVIIEISAQSDPVKYEAHKEITDGVANYKK